MKLAVSFCNQKRVTGCGLAVVDRDQMRWAPKPDRVDSTGATGMALVGDRLGLSAQVPATGTTLLEFDRYWNGGVRTISGPADPHDIACADDGLLLASSGTDRIWALGSTPFELWSAGDAWVDEHHVNGVTSEDGRVLASMFGAKRGRSWAQVKEGRVIAIPSGEVVVEGLHHPHSPRLHEGELWVCDSGRGEVVVVAGSREERVKLGGYTRGLWIGDDVALVGVSAARTRSRSQGTKNLVSEDATWSGVAVVNRDRLTVTDRIDLSALGAEVYDILPVDAFQLPVGLDARVEHNMRLHQTIDRLEDDLDRVGNELESARSTRGSAMNLARNVSQSIRRRARAAPRPSLSRRPQQG